MIESTDSLARKTARGVFWVFTLRFADRGLGLLRTIILARLLAPQDFGVMGIALVILSGLEVLTMTGFDAALIHKKGDIRSHLDAAWAAQFIRGLFISIALFLTAPLVAAFFQAPRVTTVLQILALSELIKGCQNIGIVYFHKDFEFHKEFLYRFSNTLVKLAVSIPAALILKDALALVLGIVVGELVSCYMSYVLNSYRPRLRADWDKMKELFAFGKWILGSSLLTFLCNQGDDLFVGKVLGASTLGLYQMAYLISNLPATEITHVASQVSFPAYARLQDSPERLQQMHLTVLRLVALVSIPLATGIFFLSADFTTLFLGPNWEPMVPAMQLLAVWGLLRSVGAPIGALLKGIGKPHILTYIQVGKLILLSICIYPMTSLWGLTGAAVAVVIHTLPIEFYVHYLAMRIVKCPATSYLKALYWPVFASLIMLAVLFVLREYLFGSGSVVAFGSLICLGVLSYACVVAIVESCFQYGLRDTLSSFRARPLPDGAPAITRS